MKKLQKNAIVVGLIIASIVLLLVLQVFWLRSAYRDAADDFNKETSFLFRNTIFAMHDSIIQQNVELLPAHDTVPGIQRRARFDRATTFGSMHAGTELDYINIKDSAARIEVFGTVLGPDSIQRVLRPLINKMQMSKEPKRFIIRLGPDSLKVDSIKHHYREALTEAGIQASFDVITYKTPRGERIEKSLAKRGGVVSEIVPFTPMHRYAVAFPDIQLLLLRKITPQILFSIFLTLLTTGSFYAMYRHLRAQQRLMQIKNDFISNVTHELKTPVATVSVALEALKNFHALDDPERTAAYLEMAQNELSRLTLMTDKILKTAVYEAQGVAMHTETINLDAMVKKVLASMKLVFENREIAVHYEKEGEGFQIEGSAEHLTNVLYNLLDNALKYSDDGASIVVKLKTLPGQIVLSVVDNGIGIAVEYQQRIFEKFFRVPSGDVHNTKGYGLGLSYVASVVKSHQGTIDVESQPGKGSTFSLCFPLTR